MSNDAFKVVGSILLVDDTKTDRDLFKFLLGRYGFIVQTAADGIEALELLNKNDFDLILSDYLMPNMDGHEFLRKIRQEPKFSHVIVIIITSDESDEIKDKLLKGGANDFVHKGDSPAEIMARIKVHLNAQAANTDRKVLEVACDLADKISQPLSSILALLDELKEKAQKELPESQRQVFLGLLNNINKEADAMSSISQHLKELKINARS